MSTNSEKVSVYITTTGEIIYPTYRENGIDPTLNAGESLIEGHWAPQDYYILSGVATDRPTVLDDDSDNAEIDIELTVGVNQTIIASLPEDTEVTSDDFYEQATAGEPLEVKAERNGVFEIEIDPPFPYKSLTLRLVVTDAD